MLGRVRGKVCNGQRWEQSKAVNVRKLEFQIFILVKNDGSGRKGRPSRGECRRCFEGRNWRDNQSQYWKRQNANESVGGGKRRVIRSSFGAQRGTLTVPWATNRSVRVVSFGYSSGVRGCRNRRCRRGSPNGGQGHQWAHRLSSREMVKARTERGSITRELMHRKADGSRVRAVRKGDDPSRWTEGTGQDCGTELRKCTEK